MRHNLLYECTMEILKKLRSGFLNKTNNAFYKKRAIDGYIHMCESLYRLCEPILPGKDPHEYLMTVLGIIWVKAGALKENQLDDPAQFGEMLNYTLIPACVPPPFQEGILAYKLIREDKELFSFLTAEYSSFNDECNKQIKSVLDARNNGTLKTLYSRYNKNPERLELLFPSDNEKNKMGYWNVNHRKTSGKIKISYHNLGVGIRESIGKAEKTINTDRLIFYK